MKDKGTKLEYFCNGQLFSIFYNFFKKRKNYEEKGNTISEAVSHQ